MRIVQRVISSIFHDPCMHSKSIIDDISCLTLPLRALIQRVIPVDDESYTC